MTRWNPEPAYVRVMRRTHATPEGCVLFDGFIDPGGYGRVQDGTGAHPAHRIVYLEKVGPIPVGWHVDHLCHNRTPECREGDACLHRRCVNPEHLEAVPPRVNAQRGTERITLCRFGHPLVQQSSQRVCRLSA